jgi:hypothetical protein
MLAAEIGQLKDVLHVQRVKEDTARSWHLLALVRLGGIFAVGYGRFARNGVLLMIQSLSRGGVRDPL